MKNISVTLPDGSVRQVPEGSTAQAVAASIGRGLEKAAVAAKVNGKEYDLNRPLPGDCQLAIITRDSKEALEVLRHSTAHLLAQAIKETWPKAQITIGPVIEDGFYYDIDLEQKLSPDDLPKLEKKMEEIAARKLEVKRDEWPRDKAIEYFKKIGEAFKAEIIHDLKDPVVSVYTQGDFTDLCRGPHVPNTERLGKFKLTSIAGAYWRGDEKNKMLQRIYGTAFANQKDLDEHLHRIEEARKRDHRRLGQELELFTFLQIAPAMPFYLPKGTMLWNLMASFIRDRMRKDYREVICPQLMTTELWKTSGHYDNYRDNMFFTDPGGEGETTMSLKPMNCPGHAALFKTSLHSYRDLPLRLAELSKLHRYERAGVTHGLFRTRTFSQDDAHIFCTPDQVQSEVRKVIKDTYEVYKIFGFDQVKVRLGTRPKANSLGTDEGWNHAIAQLAESLKAEGLEYELADGEGAFYGPKIEFHIRDSIGRYWQCGTVQYDPYLPERFGLEYVDTDNSAKRPIMLHRAIFGSLERFMGILLEHHNGHLPAWISPLQAVVIGVTDAQSAYATELATAMDGWGIRVETDLRNEKLGYRIRDAQLKKIPWMVVAGQKEQEARTVTVRKSTGENLDPMSWEEFHKYLKSFQVPGSQPLGGKTHSTL